MSGQPAAEPLVMSTVSDGVSVITLNRPHRLNAMTPELMRELTYAIRDADAEPDVRVMVVTGAGKGFCSGADLELLAAGPQALEEFASGVDAHALFASAASMRTPLVMAVNGAAAGAGFVLSLIADVRFASSSAVFWSAFSRLGLTAEYAAAWLLPRIVGPGRAREILLSGRPVQAEEAERIGLVSSVTDDALSAALDWAHDVANNCSPASLAAIKAQLADAQSQDLPEHLDDSLAWMTRSFRWPELAEALEARKERRAPSFPWRDLTDLT